MAWRTKQTYLERQRETQQDARSWNALFGGFAALAVLVLVAIAILAPRLGADSAAADRTPQADAGRIVLDAGAIDISSAMENPSLTPPDFAAAVSGDRGARRLPLGMVNELPGDEYLDFLFEFCQPECYRDAHFMNSQSPELGSGTWLAERPFHVRHGFANSDTEPLGEDFEVVMYITLEEDAGESALEGNVLVPGRTYRLHSDYVVRGVADRCGPMYKTQTEPQTCEWFIHDFPNGLPEGRYDLWTAWEAPCWAWIELGFMDLCDDPDAVLSLFTSGVNAPFGRSSPSFSEANES